MANPDGTLLQQLAMRLRDQTLEIAELSRTVATQRERITDLQIEVGKRRHHWAAAEETHPVTVKAVTVPADRRLISR
jgi:hypothetical protein